MLVCLFEGFKPEFWKGGLGGHLLSEVSNRVLFGGWEIFFFYHHVRRRVRCGSFVCLFVLSA